MVRNGQGVKAVVKAALFGEGGDDAGDDGDAVHNHAITTVDCNAIVSRIEGITKRLVSGKTAVEGLHRHSYQQAPSWQGQVHHLAIDMVTNVDCVGRHDGRACPHAAERKRSLSKHERRLRIDYDHGPTEIADLQIAIRACGGEEPNYALVNHFLYATTWSTLYIGVDETMDVCPNLAPRCSRLHNSPGHSEVAQGQECHTRDSSRGWNADIIAGKFALSPLTHTVLLPSPLGPEILSEAARQYLQERNHVYAQMLGTLALAPPVAAQTSWSEMALPAPPAEWPASQLTVCAALAWLRQSVLGDVADMLAVLLALVALACTRTQVAVALCWVAQHSRDLLFLLMWLPAWHSAATTAAVAAATSALLAWACAKGGPLLKHAAVLFYLIAATTTLQEMHQRHTWNSLTGDVTHWLLLKAISSLGRSALKAVLRSKLAVGPVAASTFEAIRHCVCG